MGRWKFGGRGVAARWFGKIALVLSTSDDRQDRFLLFWMAIGKKKPAKILLPRDQNSQILIA
jgi:hypothetical protein